ncbi:MAG: ABC transporter ATP-binding protein [Bdellovibrionales bacterium GWB1_55_8]|nr:MAG: ABC transporter ATP-binding protein [Bdellovibrionales bacterium GWB1_55_8]
MRDVGIRVTELRKKLGTNLALQGVHADFRAGSLNGLIGPEGAGKTTLLRTILGLLKADQGEINFSKGGEPCSFDEVRPTIAYMPQQQSLYPDLSIAEHLEFFKELYAISDSDFKKRREELLQITRLTQFTDRSAGKLSGGMYKKLGLMCALLQSPSVLLLDEPTNGVDPISRREFWELLYQLRDRKILVILTTAYMDEAERCETVHLLDEGRVIASGEPRKVLAQAGAGSFDEIFVRNAREAHGR